MTKKLGEVCCIRKLQGAHHLPYVGLEDIESNTARFVGPTEPRIVKSLTFKFGARHVLYGRLRPYLNKAIVPNFTGHCSTEIFPLEPSSALSRYYLLYWLLFDPTMQSINSTCTGARMPRADMGAVLNFDLPLPPLPEQQRIVGILDAAFASIATAKENVARNLANIKELFTRAAVEDIFGDPDTQGWRTSYVENLAIPKKGAIRTGPFGSQLLHSEFVESGIAVLGIDNAVDNTFKWKQPRFITQEKYEQLSRYTVFPGDVIITIMGTCGRCAVVPDGIPLSINTKHLCCITLDTNKCEPSFLHAYFLYHPVAKSFLSAEAKGAIMSGLNMGIIKAMPVRYPSLPEQQRIVAQLDALSARCKELEQVYIEKLALLDELKHSLRHQAFNGEL